MSSYDNITVIIPSLDPDARLLEVVGGVIEQGFTDILLVDDGSADENKHFFEEAAAQFGCTVLHHPVNYGKGRALKTAFQWVTDNRPDVLGCVTIDGDNQHHPEDIAACVDRMLAGGCKELVLGVRDFNSENVPPKSRFGNKCTSGVFKLLCGLTITDTQTGLRVFPKFCLPTMLAIEGERFEYETNMLLVCKKENIPLAEQIIRTIYIDDNATTHFHPIKDSIRIYRIILRFTLGNAYSFLKFSLVSVLSFLIDNGLFNLLFWLTEKKVAVSTGVARIVSSLFNYTMNRKTVFKSQSSVKKTAVRYYILCVCQWAVSTGLLKLLSLWLGNGSLLMAVLKICVDLFLYLISYRIQQKWVFAEENAPEHER